MQSTSNGWTTSATVSPSSILVGDVASISATVSSNRFRKALVDLEVFDSSGARAYQQAFDNQAFQANRPVQYTVSWKPATAGQYTVKVGLFGPGWSGLQSWNNNAATFLVGVSEVPTANGWTTYATVASSSSLTGETIGLSAFVLCDRAATALVDVEVYDGAGARVFQQAFDNQSFEANGAIAFTSSWKPATAGTYTMGILFRTGLGWAPDLERCRWQVHCNGAHGSVDPAADGAPSANRDAHPYAD